MGSDACAGKPSGSRGVRSRHASRTLATVLAAVLLLTACGRGGPLSPSTPTAAPTVQPAPTKPGALATATVGTIPVKANPAATKPQAESKLAAPATTAAAAAETKPSAAQPALPNVADAADKVRPAVAFISVSAGQSRAIGGAQPRQGVGSGAIFDPRGFIFTNNHVVEGGNAIKVALPDGRTFDAQLVGRDPPTDLAVIKIEGANLPVAPMGDSGKLKVGEWVVAIGNALGLEGGPTVTAGVVSALNRSVDEPGGVGGIENAIQTDTAINPGNSGGPLINLAGEIVGINTMVAGQVAPNYQAQGIGFAISINSAKPIIAELVAKGRVDRPYLGVTVATLTPAIAQQLGIRFVEGIVLSSVSRNAPAARAGLREGDVVTAIGGDPIKNTEGLREALAKRKVGDRVEVTVARGAQTTRVQVELGQRPAG